jgi:O-acetyl-ADP-ribose deacetylase (regulator of RNase III)
LPFNKHFGSPAMSAPLLAATADGELESVGSPAMSAPSLAATADGQLESVGLPAMSAPSLAATADGELESVGSPAMSAPSLAATAIRLASTIYLARRDVYALVGRDRHSACFYNNNY